MRRAYHAESALAAEAEMCALAAELDKTHPGAAASLREGMDETLTGLRLGVPPTLAHPAVHERDLGVWIKGSVEALLPRPTLKAALTLIRIRE